MFRTSFIIPHIVRILPQANNPTRDLTTRTILCLPIACLASDILVAIVQCRSTRIIAKHKKTHRGNNLLIPVNLSNHPQASSPPPGLFSFSQSHSINQVNSTRQRWSLTCKTAESNTPHSWHPQFSNHSSSQPNHLNSLQVKEVGDG